MERGIGILEDDAKNSQGIRFDLEHWALANAANAIGINCDTVGCAVGLFCLSGAFEADGLYHTISFFGVLYPWFASPENPEYKNRFGYEAVAALFEITTEESEYLFSPASYFKKQGAEAELAVANRMRLFITGEREETPPEEDWKP